MPIGEVWVQERGCNDYDVNNHASAATPAESFPSLKPQQPPDPASQQQTWAAQSTEVADAVASWSFSTQGGPSLEGAAHNTTGNGGLEALTPRQSEVDREEATINPTSVSRTPRGILGAIWIHCTVMLILSQINWEHHGLLPVSLTYPWSCPIDIPQDRHLGSRSALSPVCDGSLGASATARSQRSPKG